jgi:hypothetical protein
MTVYVEIGNNGKQRLMSKGHELTTEEQKKLKGMAIKNVQKMDGVIMFTLK